MLIAIYDNEGKLILTTTSLKDIKDLVGVSSPTVSKALQNGWKIMGHTARKLKDNEKPPKQIDVEKPMPKFRATDGKLKRMYLAYDTEGYLAVDKPMCMQEITEHLNVTKHTILDSIIKNHLSNNHIIKVAKSLTQFPQRLSPFSPEFKVFQYNRAGELVTWYTTITVTHKKTGIPYNTIRNCIIKAASTDKHYYFTNCLPLSGYKKISVRFIPKYKPIQLKIINSADQTTEIMSLNKACQYTNTSYHKLRRKIKESPQIIHKGFMIERVNS